MALAVQVLHLSIVSPLVRDEEGCPDGTPVRVEAVPEEPLVEALVQVVDGVVKGDED